MSLARSNGRVIRIANKLVRTPRVIDIDWNQKINFNDISFSKGSKSYADLAIIETLENGLVKKATAINEIHIYDYFFSYYTPVQAGHIYYSRYSLMSNNPKHGADLFTSGKNDTVVYNKSVLNTANEWVVSSHIFTEERNNDYIGMGLVGSTYQIQVGDWLAIKDVSFIDLTQMFGEGNEPLDINDERIQWINNYLLEHPELNLSRKMKMTLYGNLK